MSTNDDEPPQLQRFDAFDAPEKQSSRFIRRTNAQLRMKGQAYLGFEKTTVKASSQTKAQDGKTQRPPCTSPACSKSTKRKCSEITPEERANLFDNFWMNKDWGQKRTYITGLIDVKPPAVKRTKKDNSKRGQTFAYFLDVQGGRIPVCQTMFLNTFDLKQSRVLEWKNKSMAQAENPMPPPAPPKPKSERQQIAEDFVNALPKQPSHYCRSRSNRVYLTSEIKTKRELARSFNSWCAEKNLHPVPSEKFLRNELKRQNVSLFVPKKDQCDTCVAYKEGNVAEDDYNAHMARRQAAREEKQRDKEDGDDSHSVWAMDVQAVLILPRLYASALYYKTKLASHNFTFYNLKTKDVRIYYWTEVEGDVSANCFASCVRDLLADVISKGIVTRFTLFSDGCGYQNRNSLLSNALLDFAVANGCEVTQKYLERGHTQMEVDSVHSSIEVRLKNRNIYYPGNYCDVFRECRPQQPYELRELTHEFFLNFSSVKYVDSIRPGRAAGDPTVHDLRLLRYVSSPAPKIEFKTDFDQEFQELPQRIKMPRDQWEMERLFHGKLPIKKSKFEHLQQLKHVMPEIYHDFYDRLSHK